MRRVPLLLGLLLSCRLAQAAVAPAWDRVWRSEDAIQGLSLEGRVRTMMLLGDRSVQAEAALRVAHGRLRFDYESGNRRWSLIDDGRNLVSLRPTRQKATVLPRPRLAFDRSLAERNYLARQAGSERVADRVADILEICPRSGGVAVWRLWLERGTSFALKRERYNVDGKLTSASECITLRTAAVPDEAFAIPAGWEREEAWVPGPPLPIEKLSRDLGFPVKSPRYLPAGYVWLGGHRGRESRGRPPAAELRYTDGLRMLTIVEGQRGPRRREPDGDRHRRWEEGRPPREPHPPPGGMTVTRAGGEKVLRYHHGERAVFVMGDLKDDELVRIAHSLDP